MMWNVESKFWNPLTHTQPACHTCIRIYCTVLYAHPQPAHTTHNLCPLMFVECFAALPSSNFICHNFSVLHIMQWVIPDVLSKLFIYLLRHFISISIYIHIYTLFYTVQIHTPNSEMNECTEYFKRNSRFIFNLLLYAIRVDTIL